MASEWEMMLVLIRGPKRDAAVVISECPAVILMLFAMQNQPFIDHFTEEC